MRISRLPLTAKLASINLLLVLSLAAVLVVAWRMLPADHDAADGVAQLGRAQRANQNADMLHDALRSELLSALLAGQVEGVSAERVEASLSRSAAEFRDEMRSLGAMNLPGAVQPQLAAARESARRYVAQVEHTARLALLDRRQALASMAEFDRAFEGARADLGELTGALALAMEDANRRGRRSTERARVVLAVAALAAVLVGLSCVTLIGRSIRRSLTELRDVARDVAGGNLGRRSERPGDDEVGQLATSVNQMAGSLQHMIEQMRQEAERGSFRVELAQALDMADSEEQACDVVARAMQQISPLHAMELLAADSSDAHLERAASHPLAGAPGCGVGSPYGCVAVRSGHAVRFAHSAALNACPKLRGRPSGEVMAACVPVTFMGRALGVLHVAGDPLLPITDTQFDRLCMLGAQVGGRIGTVRAFERSQLQASTDALTGLANRRTVEKRLRDLGRRDEPFALVLCDLDHFKRLNDTYGHPVGDEALRLFAEVARGSVRESDLAGRWGGEEFAFVLPGVGVDEGLTWTQRVRERLAHTLAQRSTPAFTASFGVAAADAAVQIDELVRTADEALYRAKRDGRDRAVVAGTAPGDSDLPLARESERRAAVDLRLLAQSS